MPGDRMPNRLADAVSPYLRSHADNPVDWWPWGEDAFDEAARRDVPVLVSIGYATCHWCHVMARESFSDPELAAHLNARFVAIKVDREEHPDVDAAMLAAAGVFTPNLGWPLTVFTTPDAAAFYAGTYFPPRPVGQVPAFRTVLDAVDEAWRERRAEVEGTGAAVRDALARAEKALDRGARLDEPALADAVERLEQLEDPEHGGLGTGSKFPNAPVLSFLVARAAAGDARAAGFAGRELGVLAASPLRDPIEGGFFRYAVRRDWSEPHFERMLSDNAQLLRLSAAPGVDAPAVVEGVAGFLTDVLALPSGAFASAQDSESTLDGARVEGGYYALDAHARARQPRPPLDDKVLTGLNGLALGALAEAGSRAGRPEWIAAAERAAEAVLDLHLRSASAGPQLARTSRDGVVSAAPATLEDYGGLAGGLLRLALAAGAPRFAELARDLVLACAPDGSGEVAAPESADPVLAARGAAPEPTPSDGATPSGRALLADAALLLAAVSDDPRFRAIAERAVAPALAAAREQPSAFGAALEIAHRLAAPARQLVVVRGADDAARLESVARAAPGLVAIVDESTARAFADAGFALFAGRGAVSGRSTAYACREFVCALPTSDADELARLLTAPRSGDGDRNVIAPR